MKILRSLIAWTLLHWALKAWHPSDPMRLRCAEFLQAMGLWDRRYADDERQRRELKRLWKEKLAGKAEADQ